MRAYIAGPFFNQEQTARVEEVKTACMKAEWEYFSPKDENLWKPGGDPIAVVRANTDAIDACDAIVVITDGKDMGTLFEAGYAHAREKPAIYVWFKKPEGAKYNIMLAATGDFAHTELDIVVALAGAARQLAGLKSHTRVEINDNDME